MEDNVYEGMFILDSNRYARDPAGVPRKIDDLIKKLGGEILVSRLWSEQKLAYPIDGHSKGTYWLTYCRVAGEKIAGLERQCQLNENILRVLYVKVDPRIVDALVAHAVAGDAAPVEETPEGEPAAAEAGEKA